MKNESEFDWYGERRQEHGAGNRCWGKNESRSARIREMDELLSEALWIPHIAVGCICDGVVHKKTRSNYERCIEMLASSRLSSANGNKSIAKELLGAVLPGELKDRLFYQVKMSELYLTIDWWVYVVKYSRSSVGSREAVQGGLVDVVPCIEFVTEAGQELNTHAVLAAIQCDVRLEMEQQIESGEFTRWVFEDPATAFILDDGQDDGPFCTSN